MIRLKSLVEYEVPEREMPSIDRYIAAIKRDLFGNRGFSPSSSEEERKGIEQYLNYSLPYKIGTTSEGRKREINTIADEWFMRKYIQSKSAGK